MVLISDPNLYSNLDPNIKKYMSDMQNLTNLVIRKELKKILSKIADDMNINQDVLYSKYLTDETNIDNTDTTNKTNKTNTSDTQNSPDNVFVENKYKCIAITKKCRQCTRNKYETNDFCKNHLRLSRLSNGLTHGTIYNKININNNPKIIPVNISSSSDENEIILEPILKDDEYLFYDKINNKYYKKDFENNAINVIINN